jgi:hypothetical protein
MDVWVLMGLAVTAGLSGIIGLLLRAPIGGQDHCGFHFGARRHGCECDDTGGTVTSIDDDIVYAARARAGLEAVGWTA